jgi:hypothetical protein
MTVDHRRPAVKTKIQFVDSTRPPLEFNGFEKTKRADDLGLPLSTILLPPATFSSTFYSPPFKASTQASEASRKSLIQRRGRAIFCFHPTPSFTTKSYDFF